MSNTDSKPTGTRFQDLTGQTYGRLTVLNYNGKSPSGQTLWGCQCSCLNTKIVGARHLKSGGVASCGCFQQECRTTHGLHHTPEHKAWARMWNRCTNTEQKDYLRYSKRTPPEIWRDFEVFFKELGLRPGSEYSLDRIRNELPYGPGNCKWSTREEQQRNTKRTRNLTYQGVTKCLTEWARELKIHPSGLSSRIKRWGLEKALSTTKLGTLVV